MVDVGMVDPSCEAYLRWTEGVICWKLDFEEENSAFVGTAIRADHSGLPMEHIVFIRWAGTDIVNWVLVQI